MDSQLREGPLGVLEKKKIQKTTFKLPESGAKSLKEDIGASFYLQQVNQGN